MSLGISMLESTDDFIIGENTEIDRSILAEVRFETGCYVPMTTQEHRDNIGINQGWLHYLAFQQMRACDAELSLL